MYSRFFDDYKDKINNIEQEVCPICCTYTPNCDCVADKEEDFRKMRETEKMPEWEKRLNFLINQNKQRVAAKTHKIDVYRRKPKEIEEHIKFMQEL